MKIIMLGTVTVLALVGCGGGTGPCVARAGSFKVHSSTASGNCGDVSDLVITVNPNDKSVPAGCVDNGSSESADLCSITAAYKCSTANGGTITINSVGKWNTEGTSATATEGIIVSTPSGACNGTYDLSYTKIQ